MATNTITLHSPSITQTHLRTVQPSGWTSGLGNLLRHELRPWWSTRFGLIQAAVWLFAINGFLALPLWIAPLFEDKGVVVDMESGGPFQLGMRLFFVLAVQIGGLGTAILSMGAIVGEKQSGTAAWVLSKPASRTSFVLAKLLALAAGTFGMVVTLQSAVAYVHIGVVSGTWPDPALFVTGSALVTLYVLFALSLTLMLGTLLNSRGAVTSIALGVLLGQSFLGGLLGPVAAYLPNNLGNLAASVATGGPIPSFAPIASAAILTIVFVVAAVWRFNRDEL